MVEEVTFRGKLVATKTDWLNYTSYVFENMEPADPSLKYIMCVRFPNWAGDSIEIGDVGFVTVRYVEAGDTFFDGSDFVAYKNTDIHFIKFVPEKAPAEDVTVVL